MSKYATLDIQICFKCDTIAPDSHASSYKHRAPISSQEVTHFSPSSDPVNTKYYGETSALNKQPRA